MNAAERFGRNLEDYWGGPYTPTQMREVKRWAERYSERLLNTVYRFLVATEETRYKQPPTVAVLNKALHEVLEAYPELRGESYNKQVAAARTQIAEDAGWTQDEIEANLRRLNEMVGNTADARRMA